MLDVNFRPEVFGLKCNTDFEVHVNVNVHVNVPLNTYVMWSACTCVLSSSVGLSPIWDTISASLSAVTSTGSMMIAYWMMMMMMMIQMYM